MQTGTLCFRLKGNGRKCGIVPSSGMDNSLQVRLPTSQKKSLQRYGIKIASVIYDMYSAQRCITEVIETFIISNNIVRMGASILTYIHI
jgi:hypothetical protein